MLSGSHPGQFGLSRAVCYCVFFLFGPITAFSQTADFTADATGVCPGTFINYSDASTFPGGASINYTWNFPGGFPNDVTLANPTVYYPSPGVYSVSLQICEAGVPGSCDTEIKTGYITVHADPDASFSWTIPDACAGLSVQFTDISSLGSAALTDWFYDFDDGAGSINQSPLHTFPAVSTYEVLFLITDANGCQDDTIINVQPTSEMVTSVNVDTALSCNGAPLTVNLSASASGGSAPYTYTWDYGNGSGGSGPGVTANYSGCGTYTISLETEDVTGCIINEVFTNAVEIFCPVIDFIQSADSVCVGEDFTVSDASSPLPSAMTWTFDPGDPSSSTTAWSPTYNYTSPGTYMVEHCVRFSNGCEECISKPVVVRNKPLGGSISITDSVSCTVPFTTSLSAVGVSGTGVINYTWYIGSNVYSGATITPTITSSGNYSVSLVISDESGCTDSIYKHNLIRIQPVNALFTMDPSEGCAPVTTTLANNSYSPMVTIDSFSWDMGDGTMFTTTNTDSFSHTYGAIGSYPVTMIAYGNGGCNDTATMTAQFGEVNAAFALVDTTVCGSVSLINLTDYSNYTIVYWGNGDSTVLTDPLGDASYYYYELQDTASYEITLVALVDGCYDVHTVTAYVQDPVAFDRTVTRDCADPYTATIWVDPMVLSSNWCWDIGNGDTLCNMNPVTITFPGPGYYEVEILDTGSSFLDTTCLEKNIPVSITDGEPDFMLSSSYVCSPQVISFINNNTDPTFDSIQWNFEIGPSLIHGLGDTTSQMGDEHAWYFPQPDIYPVYIYSEDTSLCGGTFRDTVTVSGLTAYFKIDSSSGCDPRTVYFSDSSYTADTAIIPITSYEWRYDYAGCPDYLGVDPPPCTYPTGSYTASLRVRDGNGCVSVYSTDIVVGVSDLISSFSTAPISCDDDSVRFINTSTGTGISSYEWLFGDGNMSNAASPAHFYSTPGSYTVTLRVVDSAGCWDQSTEVISVSEGSSDIGFTITYLSSGTCPPIPVELADTSSGTVVSQQWIVETNTGTEFYSGATVVHSYLYAGLFDITLITTDAKGCTDTLTRTDEVTIPGPSGELYISPDSGCAPLNVFFDLENINATQIFIDFDNGDTLEVFGDFNYIYNDPGNYCPRMILLDASGCETKYNCPGTILVSDSPVALASLSDTLLCDGGEVTVYNMIDTSGWMSPLESIEILFGDGASSSYSTLFDSVQHTYGAGGSYTLQVIAVNEAGCTDTFSADITVSSNPVAEIVFAGIEGCAPVSASFDVVGLSADSAWLDFGDGNISLITGAVSHTYNSPGRFKPSLFLKNNSGCFATVIPSDSVIAGYDPQAVLGVLPDTIRCQGGLFQFVNETIDTVSDPLLNAVDSLHLYFDGVLIAAAAVLDTFEYAENNAGTFPVLLRASNELGCADSAIRWVEVQPVPLALAGPDVLICPGLPVELTGSGTLGATDFSWSPAAYLDDASLADPTATVPGQTTFVLTATSGICSSEDSVLVDVVEDLNLSAGPDADFCIGGTVELSATLDESIAGISWIWSPAATLDDPFSLTPVASPTSDAAYTITAVCGDLEEAEMVFVDINPLPDVDITSDSSVVIAGSSIDLTAVGSGGTGSLGYLWFDPVSCPDCPVTQVAPVEDGWYTVQVTDEKGCQGIDSIYLRVVTDCLTETFQIGKAFTPNADGLNDNFRFHAETILDIDYFRVFDRWGETVFETNTIGTAWDGSYRGKELTPGVFVYVIEGTCINGEHFIKSGDVTLIK